MAAALKDLYTSDMIETLCRALKQRVATFDSAGCVSAIFDDGWRKRALKERMRHIAEMLHVFLPQNYDEAVAILMAVSPEFSGFEYMFFPMFVDIYGLEHFERSMCALEHFTKQSSSEFAVRPFIVTYGARMMRQMTVWASSDNHHVRRLASEGCRPRLPWAMALPQFKENPDEVLSLLEHLKADDSDYVRRSVANNLNDIAKDHPARVLEVAQRWLGRCAETDALVKHACRTLLKQGRPDVMALFGYRVPQHIRIRGCQCQPSVRMGESVAFSYTLESTGEALGLVRLEYAIDFLRKNGTHGYKVFKISECTSTQMTKEVGKSHSFRPISTRTYYAGQHTLSIIVNGHVLERRSFVLCQ